MKEFYIVEDGEKKGAFSLKDLQRETVLPETLVWKEGWPEWKKAKDVVADIPSFDLIINDELPPPLPSQADKPKKKNKTSMFVTAAKIAEGDIESLGSLFDSDQKAEEEKAEQEDKPSLVAVFYTFVGEHIDSLIDRNSHKIGSNILYTQLDKARKYYKSLSLVRQKSASFIISYCLFILAFLLISIMGGNFFGNVLEATLAILYFSMIYSSYVALYQIKFVDKPISKVVNVVVFFALGFLPKFLKNIIAQVVKFLIFTIVVIFFTLIIGPLYLVFRLVIAFVNPKDMPSFDRYG